VEFIETRKPLIKTSVMIIVGAVCLFLQGCQDPNIVFTRATGADGRSGGVFVIPSGQTTPVAISTIYGDATPCGHTSTGKLVLTIQTTLGKDIYLADPTTGQVQNRIIGGPNDAACVFVTPTDLIIYEINYGNGDSDIYAIQLGATIGQPVATTTHDEHFLAYAPDGHIIFIRQSYLTLQQYDILSTTIGGQPVMLAQVFPPGIYAPAFNGVTPDNHVIFSEYVEFQQGSVSLNIYSVKTDGTGQALVAKDTQGSELFCKISTDNHVLYTDQYSSSIEGEQISGDIYMANPDGTGTLALTPGVNHHNNTCRGITPSNYLIFSRGDISTTRGPEQLYSVVADGKSTPILLADSKDQLGFTVTNYFAGITPWNVVVFTTDTTQDVPGGTQFSRTLNSIMPDGSSPMTLTNNVNAVGGFTITNKIIYNAQVPANGPGAYNMFSVPASGGAAPTQLSSSPNLDYFNFFF
jgi:hypothetical protein